MSLATIALIVFIVLIVLLIVVLVLYYTGTLPNTYPNFIKKYELEKINKVFTRLKTTTDKATIDRECTSIKDDSIRLRDKIKSSDKIFIMSKGRVEPIKAVELYMGDNARSTACVHILDAPSSNVGSSNVGSTNATSNVGSSNVSGLTTTTSTYIIEDDRFAPF